jgi:hypothetical protein
MSKNQDLGELINGIKSLATNQLNAPAYTSATAFTGTIAGYLGFDTSGNILTSGASSQWITSGLNIYYNTGNVAVGTTSLTYKFNVLPTPTAAGFDGLVITTGLVDVIGLYRTGSSYSFGMVGSNQSWIYSNFGDLNILADAASASIKFGTNNGVERLRINSLGNVGIGTINPETYSLSGKHLELFGGASYSFFHFNTNTVKAFLATNESAGTAALFSFSNHPLYLGTNNTARMIINTTGNIGMGVNTPAYKLDVAGDVNITGSFRVNGTPIGTGGGGVSGSGSTNFLAKWSAGTALTNSQIFDNGSSIGFKTSSPFYGIDYALTGSLRLGYFIGSIDGTDNASGIVAHNGNGITQTVPFGFSGSKFAFYIATNEAMRIDTNRNLLINTTGGVTGGGALQVNGDVNVTGTFKVNGVQYNTGGGGGNISGSGSTNYVPKFTGSTSLGDSALYDDGNFSMIIGATGFSNAIPLRAQKYLGVYGPASSGIILRTADGDPNLASVITREFGAGNGMYIYDDRQIWLGQSGLLQVINISNNAVGIKTSAVGTPYALNLPNDALNAARAFSWYTYSDERVKRDIEEINYGINEVMKMKPVRYKHYSSVFENNTWKLENQYSTEIGFVAQEMDKIIKEVVIRGSETELWSLDKSKLIPVLVKAVQELKAELDLIKTNIA